jgi:hypothetical protein
MLTAITPPKKMGARAICPENADATLALSVEPLAKCALARAPLRPLSITLLRMMEGYQGHFRILTSLRKRMTSMRTISMRCPQASRPVESAPKVQGYNFSTTI